MEAWDWLRALLALCATMALIGVVGYGARRFNLLPSMAGGPGKRLSIVESLALDPRRRLILVRLDGLDHLVLLSPHGDRAIASSAAPTAGPSTLAMEANP